MILPGAARRVLLAGLALVLWASVASATLTNPPGFLPDDGSALFIYNDSVISVEVLDAIGSGAGSTFGFFFLSEPGTLIPIFGLDDEPSPQSAVIDFTAGMVFDADAGVVESAFGGAGPIGFFLAFVTPGGPLSLFSAPFLNPGGIDPVATFPGEGDPFTYVIAFEDPSNPGTPLAFEIASGILPVGPAVAEPSTLLLCGVGLLLLARRKTRT